MGFKRPFGVRLFFRIPKLLLGFATGVCIAKAIQGCHTQVVVPLAILCGTVVLIDLFVIYRRGHGIFPE